MRIKAVGYFITLLFFLGVCNGVLVRSKNYEKNKIEIMKYADTLETEFTQEFFNYFFTGNRSSYLDEIFNYLKIHPIVMQEEIDDVPEEYAAISCLACRAGATSLITSFRRGATEATLSRMALELCLNLNLQPQNVCQGLIDFNIKHLMFIGANNPVLNARTACSVILHGECGDIPPELNFSINVDPNAPLITEPKTYDKVTKQNALKILHLSDIHYQPTYLVGGETNCREPMCCRVENGPAQREEDRAGYWGDYRSCDAPWHAIENVFDQMSSHKDIDMIYYTGDSVDHSIWETSIEFNKGIIERLNSLFKAKFPGIPIIEVLGNHEAHPTNVFPPLRVTEPDLSIQWLYDFVADKNSYWLPESALETIKQGGFYTVLIRPGLRIIALNNNDCYTYNWYLQYEQKSMARQLQWFHDTLLAAERANEKVHVVQHMPSRKRSCYQVWSREYRRIVDRFYRTISAQFNGHTHRDELFIFYDRMKDDFANNVAWNGGSTVPWRRVNPNYVVYDIDGENYHVNNYESWIYNLTEANLNPGRNPNWFKLHSFKETFNLSDLSPASLNRFVYDMARNQTKLLQFWKHKIKAGDPQLIQGCNRTCMQTTLCDIVVNELGDNRKCDELVSILNSST